jgi:Flp pilus assembly protein TadD
MKKLLIPLTLLLLNQPIAAQNKPKEKPPTQQEMEEMMREAQQLVEGLSAEDKRMMDSLGIKMPDFKKPPKATNNALKTSWEDENRIVPRRDDKRIAAIPKAVTTARMGAYVAAVQKNTAVVMSDAIKQIGIKLYNYIQQNSGNSTEAGNMATGFWLIGKPQMALYTLGKICIDDPSNTDNLSNFASMLSMQGAQHLAIPILNNLNSAYPQNSTLLNNLGQAWFGLGELVKAERYIDSALILFPFHPQANMTKAAIAESKGKKEEAKKAIEKSIQQAYTDEKKEKLEQLGQKIASIHYLLPPRRKTDVLNLNGFRSPSFPKTSLDCIRAEEEWKIFYEQIDEKIVSLEKLRINAEDAAIKGKQKRMAEANSLLHTAQKNPGIINQQIAIPFYSIRAASKLNAAMALLQRKLESYQYQIQLYTQEYLQLKKAYDEEMIRLRKEDEEQTGAGRANESYCPKYKIATDKYLNTINGKLEILYADALSLKKSMINESAYHTLYMIWPDEYQVAKLDYQIEWLNFMKKGFGAPADGSGFPFVSVTLKQYSCNNEPEEEEPELTQLQKFDDVHCEYHSEIDLKIIKFTSDCSRMKSELNLKFIEYTRMDDFEQSEGNTYVSSTIKISAEYGIGKKEKGPLKAEAKVGAAIQVEMDRKGIKDINLIAEAKLGAGTNVLDEGLEKHGSVAGKDIHDTTIEVGLEGRISIISGKGSIAGTGKLEGVRILEF